MADAPIVGKAGADASPTPLITANAGTQVFSVVSGACRVWGGRFSAPTTPGLWSSFGAGRLDDIAGEQTRIPLRPKRPAAGAARQRDTVDVQLVRERSARSGGASQGSWAAIRNDQRVGTMRSREYVCVPFLFLTAHFTSAKLPSRRSLHCATRR